MNEKQDNFFTRMFPLLGSGSTPQLLLGCLIIVLTFGIPYFLMFVSVPAQNKSAFDILLGGIITGFIFTIKYYFERSVDYSNSKKVEQAERLSEVKRSETNTTITQSP